jgi:hypothetical protein
MRLIDADRLKQDMVKSHEYHSDTSELSSNLGRDIRIIDEQPTAYDVGWVIGELDEWRRFYEKKAAGREGAIYNENSKAYKHAIDIAGRGWNEGDIIQGEDNKRR